MSSKIPILVGAGTGALVGLALRLMFGGWSPASTDNGDNRAASSALAPSKADLVVVPAEIRQAATTPSAEARAALEGGAVKFIIRGAGSSDETDVAQVLLGLGALPLCQDRGTMSVLRSGRWELVRNLDQFSQYAVGRAWEFSRRNALGIAGEQLSPSAKTYLLMPLEQELRLVGAVERALSTPLAEHSRIEITLERTPGGHVRWTLVRATRHDNSEILPNPSLPI